jgi:RNA polymerase sigma-70 factor (ECF subfamily)
MHQSHSGDHTAARQTDTTIDWSSALEEHRRWLRTVVRCRVEDDHAVDDVMQEVALAALKQNSRPRDPGRVAPWLYRVAVRQSISHCRRKGRRQRLANAVREELLHADAAVDPRDWLWTEEVRERVAEALERLSTQDRQILLLKYTEQWCYRQLAEHLGIGVNAVEYRLLRAKKRLRTQLRTLGGVEAWR